MPDARTPSETPPARSDSGKSNQPVNDLKEWNRQGILIKFIVIAVLGLLIIILYSIQFDPLTSVSVISIGIMIAGGSLLVGNLLGFLFGIPRTPQELTPNGVVASREADNSSDDRTKIPYKPNSNLEQISDWLTKILVGVGLTQINQISSQIYLFAYSLKPSLGNAASSGPFAIAIIIYFLICGFMLGYLWTRFFMAGELASSDVDAIEAIEEILNRVNAIDEGVQNRVKEVQVGVIDAIEGVQNRVKGVQDRVEDQSENDAKVLRLVDRQLNLVGNPEVPQKELNEAIEKSSSAVIGTIFNQAHSVRSQNWQVNKRLMERTIAIFTALVARDREESFHRYHGQLGYALKDKREPEWAAAEAELDKAIEIRNKLKESGWLHYEFNRALCRINQDQAFAEGRPSSRESQSNILGDLKAAAHDPDLKQKILKDNDIKEWMKQNKIDLL